MRLLSTSDETTSIGLEQGCRCDFALIRRQAEDGAETWARLRPPRPRSRLARWVGREKASALVQILVQLLLATHDAAISIT